MFYNTIWSPGDVSKIAPCRRNFSVLLRHPRDISQKFTKKWWNSFSFSFLSGMLKLYFKNVVVMNFMEDVNIAALGTSWEGHNADLTSGRALHLLGMFLKNICKYWNYVSCFLLYVYLYIFITNKITRSFNMMLLVGINNSGRYIIKIYWYFSYTLH